MRSTDEFGVAVLLPNGMLAWLRAHASVFSDVRVARAEPEPTRVSIPVHDELVQVMVAIAVTADGKLFMFVIPRAGSGPSIPAWRCCSVADSRAFSLLASAIESRLQSGNCEDFDVGKALGQRTRCRLGARTAHIRFGRVGNAGVVAVLTASARVPVASGAARIVA